jgi:PAS domain S-box-containing protein
VALSLLLTTLVAAGGWGATRLASNAARDEIRIIDLAGRQRILSQRIARLIASHHEPGHADPVALREAVTQLDSEFAMLDTLTRRVLSDPEQSDRVEQAFVAATPHRVGLITAANAILETDPAHPETVRAAQSHADAYLPIMDSSVTLIQDAFRTDLNRLGRTQLLALAGVLGVAILTYVLLVHPATRALHKQHEELVVARAQLESAAAITRVGSWELPADTLCPLWSNIVRRIHEVDDDYTPTLEEGIRFYHPDSLPVIENLVDRALKHAEPFDAELRLITAKGREVWVRSIGRPVVENGRVTRVVGAFQDIDDVVRQRALLAEQVARLEEAEELTNMGHWSWDLATGRVYWSKEVYKVHRRDPGLGEPDYAGVLALYCPKDAQRLDTAVRAAVEDGTDYANLLRTSDDEERYLMAVGRARRGPDGQITGLYGTIRDVSQEVITEKRLREESERLEVIVRSAGLGTWEWEIPTDRVHYNDLWARMLGYRPDEITQSLQQWADLVHPEDLPRAQMALDEHFAGHTDFYRCNTRMRHRDGSWVWVRTEGRVAEWSADDRPLRIVGVHVDISESKRTEDELAAALERVEAASHSKSEFLANMSHEIRTPMTAILGYADLLGEEALSDPTQRREYVDTIKRNGDHLLSIINDILDISKIESGKMTIEHIESAPGTLVTEVVAMMDVRAKAKGISLRVAFDTTVPAHIQTDPVRLRQILTNLVGNAIKFTEIGGVTVRVGTEIHSDASHHIRFEVEDTGVGMTPEQLGRLFNAFEQADASTTRRFGGSGLGLRISRRLANMLGGDISVQSTPGRGSVFTCTIPTGDLTGIPMVEPASENFEPRREARQKPPEPGSPLAGCRILLVEDGPDNQRLIAFHLRKAGAEVRIAENGRAAAERMSRDATLNTPVTNPEQFNLIVTDIQMPEMDGYTLARWLRAGGYNGPIVALTANAMAGDDQKCLDAGCDAYASKPIDRDRLVEVCRSVTGAQAPATA